MAIEGGIIPGLKWPVSFQYSLIAKSAAPDPVMIPDA